LRAKWCQETYSPDIIHGLGGAMGLARCSRLNEEEIYAINRFFLENLKLPISQTLVVQFLLSGATPPLALFPTYFNPILGGDIIPPPIFWKLLAAFIRHPSYASLADQVGGIGIPGPFIRHLVMANPAQSQLRMDQYAMGHQWFRALFYLRMTKQELPKVLPDGELETLGMLLRTDYTPKEFAALCRSAFLNEETLFINSEHPCLQSKAPAFDPSNPDTAALAYFSKNGLVCSIWRYLNPLLCLPWLVESISETQDAGAYLCLALIGMPIFGQTQHPAYDTVSLRTLLEDHPSADVAARYLSAAT